MRPRARLSEMIGENETFRIRDLWLQKEVREGTVEVYKLRGDENSADLITKVLSIG